MNRLLLAAALAGAAACEQQFPSRSPPPSSVAPSPGPDAEERLLAGAAATVEKLSVSRAMTVTSCAWSPDACRGADAGADPRYLVVFGSGRGEVRSQGQAKADLYTEIRDRTQAGERLDAESHAPASASAPSGGARAVAPRSKPNGDSDPLADGALLLLDLVDGAGEVGLDVIRGGGPQSRASDGGVSNGCSVSLGRQTDGVGARCLIQAPERGSRR